MARVIGFQPVARTDFSDGNALFSDGIKNMALAFKQAKDTIDETGQAVRDRNNAVLNSYINGISLEDWNKPETQTAIHNMVKHMSDNTSNMVDLDKVFSTIDKRQSVLVDRSNAQLENQVNNLVAQSKQDIFDASKLFAIKQQLKHTPENEVGREDKVYAFNEAFSKANPTVQQLVRDLGDDRAIKDLTTQATYLNKQGELGDAQFKQVDNIAKALVITENNLIQAINNETDPEAKAKLTEQLNATRDSINKLNLNPNKRVGLTMGVAEEKVKNAKDDEKRALDNKYKEAQINTLNTETDLKTIQVLTGGGGNSKQSGDVNKPVNDLEKVAFEKGYTPDIISNKGINPTAVKTKFFSNLNSYIQNERALEDSISYTAWKGTNEAKSIYNNKDALRSGSWGGGDIGRDFTVALENAKIEDWKKKLIHNMFAEGNFPKTNRWFAVGDGDSMDKMIEVMANNIGSRDTVSKGKAKQQALSELNTLVRISGLDELTLLLSMSGYDEKTGKIANPLQAHELELFPDNLAKRYIEVYNKQPKTKKK